MKKISRVFILIAMLLFVISCSSVPKDDSAVNTEVEDYAELNAQALAQADAARTAALSAGAKGLFSSEFEKADSVYEELKKSLQDNPSGDKSAELSDVANRFKAMECLAESKQLREKIVEYNFVDVDEAELKAGDDAVVKASELLASKGTEAYDAAKLAKTSYVNVLNKGFMPLCEAQKAEADSAKEQADSVKSAVAEKEKYAAISLIYDGANTAYTEQAYEAAYEGFSKSTVMFNELFVVVSAKRAEAEAAIARAKEKVTITENFAVEADEIAPLQEEEE
ncbi:MAG: hypothetical protein IKZ04_01715 [Spirochaetaceae bacterium]|nr:hypothetical protein [Spirochaetaceae bacterium]